MTQAAAAILKTVTGTAPLSLPNAVSRAIKSLTQYGLCTQSTTPTPSSPVDIVCNNGALKMSPNLCSSIQMGAVSPNGGITTGGNRVRTDKIAVKPSTTYAYSTNLKSAAGTSVYAIICLYDASDAVISRTSNNPASGTFTTTEDSDYVYLCWYTNSGVDESVLQTAWAQVEEGASATPYRAYASIYAGGSHPGKNLANVNEQTALVRYYINAQGVVSADANNWMYQDYVRVKPNTQYTLSMSQPVYYVTISEYSTAADSGFVVRKTGSSGSNTSLTITTEATTNYIRFGANINRAEVTLEQVLAINWQLEAGATATAYEPYEEIPYQPEVLTVRGKNMLNPASIHQGTLNGTNGKVVDASNRCYCDFIKINSGDVIYISTKTGTPPVYSNLFLYSEPDEDTFVGVANGTPVIVLYSLETETAEQVAGQPLHTSAGTNVVDVVSNVSPTQLSVEYYTSA